MSAATLESPIAKVNRAVEHYLTLKYGLHFGVDHKRRAVRAERHTDGLEYSVRIIDEIESIDSAWPIVYGEALYNLRSALDHLVFQLHVRRYRGHAPSVKRIERMPEFPIRDKPRRDRNGAILPTARWPDIGHLGASERSKIEWLQPYKGWRSSQYPPRQRIRQDRWALRDLERLCNIDKHRDLILGHTVPISVAVPTELESYGFKNYPVFGVGLKSNAVVDRWIFALPPPPESVPVDLHCFSTVGTDPGGGDSIDVLPHLGGLIHVVARIINRFAGLFPATDLADTTRVHMSRD